MWLETLDQLLHDPAPGFDCEDSGTDDTYVARVRNSAASGASPVELAIVRQQKVRGVEDAEKLYARHNGFHLFARTQQPKEYGSLMGGFELFAVHQWDEKTADIREEWDQKLRFWDRKPYGRNDFIAIGHPQGAWNYVHWVIRGPAAGRLYFWDWSMVSRRSQYIADGFPDFVEKLCNDPVQMLNKALGCFTHYYDGVTDRQWHPKRYLRDVADPGR